MGPYLSGAAVTSPDAPYNAVDYYWLSRIISAESQGEPLEGQIAVGNVVLNRVESDQFPDTIAGVVFDQKYAVQVGAGGKRHRLLRSLSPVPGSS